MTLIMLISTLFVKPESLPMPVTPDADIEISAFCWLPPFAQGLVRDVRVRWALEEAFKFHLAIGKPRIQERIHSLNSLTKEALAEIPHVKLHTPLSPSLSAGMVCFDVEGHTADQVVQKLQEQGIVASSTPYRVTHARLAPSIINNEEEIQRTLEAIKALA